MAGRIFLALLALALAAFMVVQLVVQHEFVSAEKDFGRAATSSRTHTVSRVQAAQIVREFNRVARLRPGTDAILLAYGVDALVGNRAGALALARRAVKREPDNFRSWYALGFALQGTDPAQARRAIARGHALNPLYQPPRAR